MVTKGKGRWKHTILKPVSVLYSIINPLSAINSPTSNSFAQDPSDLPPMPSLQVSWAMVFPRPHSAVTAPDIYQPSLLLQSTVHRINIWIANPQQRTPGGSGPLWESFPLLGTSATEGPAGRCRQPARKNSKAVSILWSCRKTLTPLQPCFGCPQTLVIQEDSPCFPAPDTATVTTVQALGTLQGLSHLGFPSLLKGTAPIVAVQRGQRDPELAGPAHGRSPVWTVLVEVHSVRVLLRCHVCLGQSIDWE